MALKVLNLTLADHDKPTNKIQRLLTAIVANFADIAAGKTVSTGTATTSTNAATLSKLAGVITSESLSTAAGSGQDLTITNTLVAATDIILVTRIGGTSTGGTPVVKAVPGAGSFVLTIDNKHASAAFNGTFIFGYQVIKAYA